jgi:hypothetical protein
MKKTLLSAVIIATCFGANAQQKFAKVLTASPLISVSVNNNLAKTASTSTLTPASLQTGGCALTGANSGIVYYSSAQYTTTPTYTIDARGYAFGTDVTYYTQAGTTFTINNTTAAQKYNVTGSGITVTDVIVLAAKAKSNTPNTMIMAKIFSENVTTKAPNAQIGITATKSLNSFTTGTSYNVLSFGTPVSVTAGNFFAAIESPSIGGANKDTLAILSTKLGCSSTDSLSWTYTVYNPAAVAASWGSVNSNFGQNLDLAIFPVLNITTGLSSVTKGDLTLLAAFPNPATNEISINFGLNQSSKVEIEIYDVTGKMVNSIKLDNLEVGTHTSKVNVSNLNSGVYMYSVKSENAKMFSKFTVTK